MFSIKASIIAGFCCVADLQVEITQVNPIRHRGFASALAASEVITIKGVGEYLGRDADQEMGKYCHRPWLALFPNLGSRSSFGRQAANLWEYQPLQQRLAQPLGAFVENVHLIDGIPIP